MDRARCVDVDYSSPSLVANSNRSVRPDVLSWYLMVFHCATPTMVYKHNVMVRQPVANSDSVSSLTVHIYLNRPFYI